MNRGVRDAVALAVAAAWGMAAGDAFAKQLACQGLTAESLGVAGLAITSVEAVAKGEKAARDHCVVRGRTAERTGGDGKPYAIGFELRLPDDWNGRFVHQFNGGNDGEIRPAVGPLLGGDKADTALARGYAVVSSDAGHDGTANRDAGLAGGARFGFDAEARRNYGYGAVAILHPLARRMVEAYYGRRIAYAYGVGGSNGGRHALVAAARMPADFNGLLIGYPGLNLPKAAIQHAWDVQAFKKVNSDIRAAFSREDLNLLAGEIVKACDGLDGLADGVIADIDACQRTFRIEALQCTTGQNTRCLSAAQVDALKIIQAGPRNSRGEALYSEWAWDRGMAAQNWRFWKLESPIQTWGKMPVIAVMGASSLAQLFTTPPTRVDGTPEALEKYLLDFDFDKDAPKIFATAPGFGESAMTFMTPPGVDDPELASFRDAGGKMIVIHGVADPVFSVVDTTNWYRKLDSRNGGNALKFAAYYRIPGMPHGAGGPSTDDFDVFTALVEWVESGRAPGAIVAGVSKANAEGQAALGGIRRPLCPYPQVARHTGGDPGSAGSFACQ